jgi:adenylate kinase family enzyme
VDLDDLGVRVCILGPSNSGKSTLASAIGQARGLPIVHLDRYRHRPGTQWELRPDSEFMQLHDEAIDREQWVIDGNYSKLLPQRLARATGFILLDASAPASLLHYLVRTLSMRQRVGGLEGTSDRLSWEMIHYILGPGRTNRSKYRALFAELDLPKIYLPDRRALEGFYRRETLVADPS